MLSAEFQRREATFKRREEMLKKQDLELQESLIKFNKFLQENDSKRGRAEKKEKEEIKQRMLKEQEIVRLYEQLKRQKAQRDLMTHDLQKKLKYQHYLESVIHRNPISIPRREIPPVHHLGWHSTFLTPTMNASTFSGA